MTVPRQQPHAIAKFKHQARTAVPKPVTVPAHMQPFDFSWDTLDYWVPGYVHRLTDSERKRHKARAARKARK